MATAVDSATRPTAAARRRRELHPGAWWLWALGLAAGASFMLNPVLLAVVVAIACLVGPRAAAMPRGASRSGTTSTSASSSS